jgi:hypothetical protein
MKSNLHIFAVVMLLLVTGFTYGQDAGLADGVYSCEQRASTGKPHIITMTATTTDGVSTIVYRETIDGLEICSANLKLARKEGETMYVYVSAVTGVKDCTGGTEMQFTVNPAATGLSFQKGGSGRTFSMFKQ